MPGTTRVASSRKIQPSQNQQRSRRGLAPSAVMAAQREHGPCHSGTRLISRGWTAPSPAFGYVLLPTRETVSPTPSSAVPRSAVQARSDGRDDRDLDEKLLLSELGLDGRTRGRVHGIDPGVPGRVHLVVC